MLRDSNHDGSTKYCVRMLVMCEENYDIYQCWDLKISTAFCRKFNHVVNTQKYKVLKFE